MGLLGLWADGRRTERYWKPHLLMLLSLLSLNPESFQPRFANASPKKGGKVVVSTFIVYLRFLSAMAMTAMTAIMTTAAMAT